MQTICNSLVFCAFLSTHGGRRRRRRHRRCQSASYVCFPNLVSRVHIKLTVETRCRHAQIVEHELFSGEGRGGGGKGDRPSAPSKQTMQKVV